MAKAIKVAYDIGSQVLKVAIAKDQGYRFVQERLPENLMENEIVSSPNAFSQFLHRVRKDYKIPAGPCAISLPSGQSLCRFITLPSMNIEQLMVNLPYEFADFIQDNADQYLFDYAMCSPTETQIEENTMPMMAATANKRILETWTRIFSRAGAKLTTVIPPEMALINLAKRSNERDICFVDLGQRKTRAIVVNEDHIQAIREIALGCTDIDRAIASHFDVDPFLAGTYKETNYKDALSLPECMAVYEQISIELLKVINFYQFTYRDSELRGIFLIGGGSNIDPLVHAIVEALGTDNLPINEILPAGTGEYAYAIGAALEGK